MKNGKLPIKNQQHTIIRQCAVGFYFCPKGREGNHCTVDLICFFGFAFFMRLVRLHSNKLPQMLSV